MKDASILDQPFLLILPDIIDTNSAIPFPPIAKFIDRIGLGAIPTRKTSR